LNDKSIFVLDACALIALIEKEQGFEIIQALLMNPSVQCFIHAINLCEVAYDSIRHEPSLNLNQWVSKVEAFGLQTHWDIDLETLARAAYLKAQWRRIALADCFALALTYQLEGVLVTSDHGEFDPLVSVGEKSIQFFR
jgi:PIN domain nuclease of toxin-antitoxin system